MTVFASKKPWPALRFGRGSFAEQIEGVYAAMKSDTETGADPAAIRDFLAFIADGRDRSAIELQVLCVPRHPLVADRRQDSIPDGVDWVRKDIIPIQIPCVAHLCAVVVGVEGRT